MKVILNQTVPKVGKAGTVVTVKDGFARNYLFPRGLAILAEKNQVKALEVRNARVAAKSADQRAAAESLRDNLTGQTVRIVGQVGKGQGKLFGAITSSDVAEAIKNQLGFDVDRKKIALVEPIKRLGVVPVEIDLHPSVDAIVNVEVYDPNAPAEAPASEPEASAEPAMA